MLKRSRIYIELCIKLFYAGCCYGALTITNTHNLSLAASLYRVTRFVRVKLNSL